MPANSEIFAHRNTNDGVMQIEGGLMYNRGPLVEVVDGEGTIVAVILLAPGESVVMESARRP